MTLSAVGIVSLLLALAVSTSPAAAGRVDPTEALERSEAAIGGATSDHRLLRSDGSMMMLSDLRGRPLVVSLIYTSCSAVCPTATETLKVSVAKARKALGGEAFQVLTLGFDARNDTPQRMRAFAIDHSVNGDPLWHVASATPAVLNALLDEVGFSYAGAAGGFEHVTQTTILDRDGHVYRQVYGDDFPLPVFIEPLKELVFGTTAAAFTPQALADRLRFLCTVYDPKSGRYRTDYGLYMGMGAGALSLVLMAWVIVRLWLANRRAERARV
ncbi:SCO family protein [Pseudaminobacter arsenicus]|uniref:SCO family protein n=1 Tax=Borborobacter arsenicus TaxID=1851146 RepID=A0A432UZA0_9HYPH|nr:SCO family protein [Pseudaminobacter arsenicus]RUM95188.1 SCO family protein [Pseudaminobacter arsenicus]